ncbi:winged helix-turn-helix domain-containing protein [Thermosulfuriphilus sp.]
MPRILIVEDEKDIADLMALHLHKAGLETLISETGQAALEALDQGPFDLLLLDLMLPDIDGLEIIKRLKLRPEHQSLPIIVVTAKGEEMDRVLGLELGADDYVVKPFSPRELVLRVKAVLKRARLPETSEGIIHLEGLTIDETRHQVLVEGRPIKLTATEFRLLSTLARARGRVMTREVLLDKVWGYHFEGYARTVDTHIRRLRKKLGPSAELIETVWGVGYRFRD